VSLKPKVPIKLRTIIAARVDFFFLNNINTPF